MIFSTLAIGSAAKITENELVRLNITCLLCWSLHSLIYPPCGNYDLYLVQCRIFMLETPWMSVCCMSDSSLLSSRMKWKYLLAQIGRIERPFKITLLYSNCGAQEVEVLAVGSLQLRNCFHGMWQYSQVWNNQMQSEKRAEFSPVLMNVIKGSVRCDLNESWVSSGISGSAYLSQSYLHVFYVCAHMCMGSEDRVEAQSYRTDFSDPLCFSDLLCLIFLWENRAHASSSNRNGKSICLDYFGI